MAVDASVPENTPGDDKGFLQYVGHRTQKNGRSRSRKACYTFRGVRVIQEYDWEEDERPNLDIDAHTQCHAGKPGASPSFDEEDRQQNEKYHDGVGVAMESRYHDRGWRRRHQEQCRQPLARSRFQDHPYQSQAAKVGQNPWQTYPKGEWERR